MLVIYPFGVGFTILLLNSLQEGEDDESMTHTMNAYRTFLER